MFGGPPADPLEYAPGPMWLFMSNIFCCWAVSY
jgi:hypothetical protein